jgi:hypothetical protein
MKAPFTVSFVAAALLLALFATGCTQTELQRAECRYWTAVTDNLSFNHGLPRQQIAVETRTRTTETIQTVRDK